MFISRQLLFGTLGQKLKIRLPTPMLGMFRKVSISEGDGVVFIIVVLFNSVRT